MISSPLFTVIVPIYNSEKTLERCIDSILSQSFIDFELILVDDGSTDQSGLICDSYANRDSRIVVIHTENAGISSARNKGLESFKGEWVTFADSDDEYTKDAFKSIAVSISKAQSSCQLIIENVIMVPTEGNSYEVYDYFLSDLDSLYNAHWKGAVWNCMFLGSTINNNQIRFDETLRFFEDHLFFATYLNYVNSISYISTPCYIQYLPQSYSRKYCAYLGYEYMLSSYIKIRSVNRRYSTDFVDGLTMKFIQYLSSLKQTQKNDAIDVFKQNVGKDIQYSKGKKKLLIRWLHIFDSSTIWHGIFYISSKFVNCM